MRLNRGLIEATYEPVVDKGLGEAIYQAVYMYTHTNTLIEATYEPVVDRALVACESEGS